MSRAQVAFALRYPLSTARIQCHGLRQQNVHGFYYRRATLDLSEYADTTPAGWQYCIVNLVWNGPDGDVRVDTAVMRPTSYIVTFTGNIHLGGRYHLTLNWSTGRLDYRVGSYNAYPPQETGQVGFTLSGTPDNPHRGRVGFALSRVAGRGNVRFRIRRARDRGQCGFSFPQLQPAKGIGQVVWRVHQPTDRGQVGFGLRPGSQYRARVGWKTYVDVCQIIRIVSTVSPLLGWQTAQLVFYGGYHEDDIVDGNYGVWPQNIPHPHLTDERLIVMRVKHGPDNFVSVSPFINSTVGILRSRHNWDVLSLAHEGVGRTATIREIEFSLHCHGNVWFDYTIRPDSGHQKAQVGFSFKDGITWNEVELRPTRLLSTAGLSLEYHGNPGKTVPGYGATFYYDLNTTQRSRPVGYMPWGTYRPEPYYSMDVPVVRPAAPFHEYDLVYIVPPRATTVAEYLASLTEEERDAEFREFTLRWLTEKGYWTGSLFEYVIEKIGQSDFAAILIDGQTALPDIGDLPLDSLSDEARGWFVIGAFAVTAAVVVAFPKSPYVGANANAWQFSENILKTVLASGAVSSLASPDVIETVFRQLASAYGVGLPEVIQAADQALQIREDWYEEIIQNLESEYQARLDYNKAQTEYQKLQMRLSEEGENLDQLFALSERLKALEYMQVTGNIWMERDRKLRDSADDYNQRAMAK